MKKAFTLIELIITIVIIGIAAVTIPMMMGAANKLQEDTVNQDIFFKSTAVMNDILSRAWDDDTKAEDDEKGLNLIFVAKNGGRDTNLDKKKGRYRYGSLQNDNYRYFYRNDLNATAINDNETQLSGSDNISYINQYSGRFIDEGSGDAKVRYDILVRYVPDTVDDNTAKTQTATWNLSGGNNWTKEDNSTNLKRITITATRSGFSTGVSVVYFSSNIGTPGVKVK
jgi:prepilin-type N-terminal cleavage/methylation domain-containing protein